MFEFLRIFGVNPVTDDLEAPHVFVLGAQTAIGRAVVRKLKAKNQSYMFVNSFAFLDLANPDLRDVLDYVEISKCIVCTTARGFRYGKDLGRAADVGDLNFFPSLIDWAQARGIRIVFPSLAVSSKAFDLLRSAGAVDVTVPEFVDEKTRNDPVIVLYHTTTECRKSRSAKIYADGRDILTSLRGDDIAASLLDETPLPVYAESVEISAMAGYLAGRMNCTVEFANDATVAEYEADVPSFVASAANSRDKMRELYLSIVVVERHDGFRKGFEKRAQFFLDSLANHMQKIPSPATRSSS